MKKNKISFFLVGVGLLFIITSGVLLGSPFQTEASAFCEAKLTCPDGRKLVCKGSSCSANESNPNDPSCTADGKIKRCSDPVDDNNNANKDKKDGNKNVNSNTSVVSNLGFK